ncbi:hypothetical protein P879_11103 [Paragonimus westermani]|uniref:Uncharacterized protein n=1 Tax=Paragonimus westermani TaxID=34504 RepID=A0A8T0DCG1_9TREM|nr:hypothetical protein P879_11103 [Paragonimus westermani]
MHGGSIRIDTVSSHHNLTGNAICPACSDVCRNYPHNKQGRGDSTNGKQRRFSFEMVGCIITLLVAFIFLQPPS